MASLVLVHGAWVDASAWDEVADALRARGHRVAAPTLHRGTLQADTDVVQEAVDAMGEAVVACGWSYGGMVVSGLRLPAGSRLVYLCAFMPDEGEVALSLTQGHPTELDGLFKVKENGDTALEGDLDGALWADAPADKAARVRGSLRTQTLASLTTPCNRLAWREHPSTYVVASQDRVVDPALQRKMATKATRVLEWETSHSPMVSAPHLVVELLSSVAEGS
jgi:pimeloyl-ACP methyl ester carboxylesterase